MRCSWASAMWASELINSPMSANRAAVCLKLAAVSLNLAAVSADWVSVCFSRSRCRLVSSSRDSVRAWRRSSMFIASVFFLRWPFLNKAALTGSAGGLAASVVCALASVLLHHRRTGFRQARHVELQFAAAVFAGVFCDLLIFDFVVDSGLQIGPRHGSLNPPPIDEKSGSGSDLQHAAFFHFGRDVLFGGCGIHALAQLQGIDVLAVLGPDGDNLFQVVGSDGFLVSENPIVIFPKRTRILAENAAAADGRGLGPGMQLLEREVDEIEAHLGGIIRDQILPQHLRFSFAMGALEIAEHHQHHGGPGRPQAGLELRLEAVEILLEWVEVDVVDGALDDLAFLRNVDGRVLRGLSPCEFDDDLLEAGQVQIGR